MPPPRHVVFCCQYSRKLSPVRSYHCSKGIALNCSHSGTEFSIFGFNLWKSGHSAVWAIELSPVPFVTIVFSSFIRVTEFPWDGFPFQQGAHNSLMMISNKKPVCIPTNWDHTFILGTIVVITLKTHYKSIASHFICCVCELCWITLSPIKLLAFPLDSDMPSLAQNSSTPNSCS